MNHWERVDKAFEQVQGCTEAEQHAFLDQLRQTEPTVAEAVERLLGTLRTDHDFLERQAGHMVGTLMAEAVSEQGDAFELNEAQPGDAIGPYEIQGVLGEGGMGMVYLAQRLLDNVPQQVALKVIKRGMDSQALVKRFRQERAVLASLNHPHIARLLDGGTTEDGRLYFAMEYVDGQPITAYADAQQLSIDARLHLFERVCEAVQYAHQNLVVHRDLKPSNIIVTEQGEVKLVDFGIAKVLAGEEQPVYSVLETQVGQRVLTPAYAAPEQLRGDTITTASDVYALGVLLYELLVGERPFEQAARAEVERMVLEAEPARPSTAVKTRTQTAEASTMWQQTRQVSADRLRRRLQGDLDVISLKALAKEAVRRYESAGALGADVRRHLEGLPVEAQPDSVGYRMGKFVRRNRAPVAAAVAFVLLLGVFGGVYTWRQAILLAQVQDEVEKTTAVKDFLVSMFEAASEQDSGISTDSMYVRDFVDLGLANLDTLSGQPLVQAELLETLAAAYYYFGRLQRADSLDARALTIREHHLPPTDPTVLNGQRMRASNYELAGELAAADSLLNLVLDGARAIDDEHLEATVLLDRTSMYLGLAEPEVVRPDLERAYHFFSKQIPVDTVRLSSAVEYMGQLAFEEGDTDSARRYYADAIALVEEYYGPASQLLLSMLTMYTEYLIDDRVWAEAEATNERILNTTWDADFLPFMVRAYPLHQKASFAYQRGDLEAADVAYTQALAAFEVLDAGMNELLPEILLDLEAQTRRHQAAVQCEMGNYALALTLFEAEYALWQQENGDLYPNAGAGLANRAECAIRYGENASAAQWAAEGVDLLAQDVYLEPYLLVDGHAALGAVRLQEGALVEAESLLVSVQEGIPWFKGTTQMAGVAPGLAQRTTERLLQLYETTGDLAKAQSLRAGRD